MSVVVTSQFGLSVVETLETQIDGAANPAVTFDDFNASYYLDGAGTGGTPVVTKKASFIQALTAGVATIDMTSLPATGGGTFSAAGLRLIEMLLHNPTTNAGLINFAPGAANPLPLFGTGNDIDIHLGARLHWHSNNQGVDISGTVKTIDLAGTGTDVLWCLFVFG